MKKIIKIVFVLIFIIISFLCGINIGLNIQRLNDKISFIDILNGYGYTQDILSLKNKLEITEDFLTQEQLDKRDDIFHQNCDKNIDSIAKKPVIYLYGKEDNQYTNVKIKLNNGKLTTTYPKYNEILERGWNIYCNKNGIIQDENKTMDYNYLYWESTIDNNCWDLNKGFCVKGEESITFLEESLSILGLNRKEANEFIIYWLPYLENNKYNFITFQTTEYEKYANLEITPSPDNVLRIFMTITPLDKPIEITPQNLKDINNNFKRENFYIIEWGGCILNDKNN